jgi:predicted ATP-grasp superfamily ATP-dependent carboligase
MTQKKLIVSPEYPEGILVNLTSEEIAQQQIDAQNEVVRKQAEEQEKQTKIDNKQSALNKLKALGLTEEEVKSIL